MSREIKNAIKSLSQIADITAQDSYADGIVVFYRLFPDSDAGTDKALLSSPGIAATFHDTDEGKFVILKKRSVTWYGIPRINILLFLATIITTLMAGTIMEGINVLLEPWLMWKGWPFSLTLLLILGTHEFGHYYYAQRHHVDVSLPYFIPVPPPLTLVGTFGAFIKLRGPIPNRLALLEIGAAGPIAGFLVAVPALFIGLHLSQIVDLESGSLLLGENLLMQFATAVTFPSLSAEQDILLHPIAFAAWIGLLVTMLNLLPLAQLDGGHITYALFGKGQALIRKITFLIMLPMGIFLSANWLVWGLLILILMRTVEHPPIVNIDYPRTAREKIIGSICLIIIILSFIPVPFAAN
ncbi:site-2 protease family protein [Candidatus Neomarinimicrobiota bacterium]